MSDTERNLTNTSSDNEKSTTKASRPKSLELPKKEDRWISKT